MRDNNSMNNLDDFHHNLNRNYSNLDMDYNNFHTIPFDHLKTNFNEISFDLIRCSYIDQCRNYKHQHLHPHMDNLNFEYFHNPSDLGMDSKIVDLLVYQLEYRLKLMVDLDWVHMVVMERCYCLLDQDFVIELVDDDDVHDFHQQLKANERIIAHELFTSFGISTLSKINILQQNLDERVFFY